jgi:MinD superfamily P-loop ATPase
VAAKTANEYIKNNSVNTDDCKSCIKLVWKAATDAAEALKPSHNSTKPKIKPISCRGCKAIPVSKMCNECKEFSNHTA